MNTQIKQQRQRVGIAGSFINQMMGNNQSIPVVGLGGTILHYTDRSVVEVLEVSADGKTAKVEMLDAVADKSISLIHGHQNWILNPTGQTYFIVWRNNAWRTIGCEYTFTKEMIAEAEAAGFFAIGAYLSKFKPALFYEVYGGDGTSVRPTKEISGVIVKKMVYSKVNILWGTKDYYYDWSF